MSSSSSSSSSSSLLRTGTSAKSPELSGKNTSDAESLDPHPIIGDPDLADDHGDEDYDDTSSMKHKLDSTISPPVSKRTKMHQDDGLGCGTLARVECENFMCHAKFQVNFDTLVTFISGANGSGKSALIASLQVCLGLRASKTGRADNFKDLIRHSSRDNAYVRVHIRNLGANAYKPDIFGDMLIFERIIYREGSSTKLRLKQKNGKMMDITREELEKIKEQLNVFVDNPVCVLDQEHAKKFLKGSEHEKYNFFLQATNLQKYIDKTHETQIEYQNCKDKCLAAQEGLSSKQRAYDVALKKCQELQSLTKIQADVHKCDVLIAFTEVSEFEKDEKQAQDAFEKCEETGNFLRSAIPKLEEEEQVLKSKSDELNLEIQAISAELVELESRRMDHPIQDKKNQKRNLEEQEKQIKDEEKKISVQVHKLVEERKRILQANSAKNKDLAYSTERLKAIDDRLEAIEKSIQQIDDSLPEIEQKTNDEEQKLKKCNKVRSDVKSNISRLEHELNSLNNSKGNRAGNFDATLPRILEEIKQTRFEHEPVHLGMSLSLPDDMDKYRNSILIAIGSQLNTFVIRHSNDYAPLQRILERNKQAGGNRRSPYKILKMSFGHDERFLPKNTITYPTIAQVVEVSNDLAYNALAENSRFDSIVLVDSSDEAEIIAFKERPSGLIAVYDVAGSSYRQNQEFRETKAAPKFIPMKGAFDKTSDGKRLELTITLQKQKEEHDWHERNYHQIEQVIKAGKNSLSSAKQKKKSLSEEKYKLEDEKERIEKSLQTADSGNQVDKINLNIEYSNEQLSEVKRQLSIVQEELRDLDQEIQQLEPDFTDVLAQIKKKKSTRDANIEKAQKFIDKLETVDAKMNSAKDELLKLEKDHQIKKDILEERKKKTQAALKDAMELGEIYGYTERLESRLSIPDLEKQKARFQEKLKREQLKHGDKDAELLVQDAEQERDAAKKALDDSSKVIQILNERIEHLNKIHAKITKKYARFREKYEELTQSCFTQMLQQRGSGGTVQFDDEKKTLNIVYRRNESDADFTQATSNSSSSSSASGTTGTEVAGMSGGERSYATLSLLISLGRVVDTPFRIMDEFDVFMDNETRRLSIDILQEAARSAKKQYILLTPQDISTVKNMPDVRKIKMKPSDLLQTTLPFNNAN